MKITTKAPKGSEKLVLEVKNNRREARVVEEKRLIGLMLDAIAYGNKKKLTILREALEYTKKCEAEVIRIDKKIREITREMGARNYRRVDGSRATNHIIVPTYFPPVDTSTCPQVLEVTTTFVTEN